MIRSLVALALVCAGCSQSPEECELRDARTGRAALERDVAPFIADGGPFASSSSGCDEGMWCVRDDSMPARGPNRVALGFCADVCEPRASTCDARSRCIEFDSFGLCVSH